MSIAEGVDKKCPTLVQDITGSPVPWCDRSKAREEMCTAHNSGDINDTGEISAFGLASGYLVLKMIRFGLGSERREPINIG